jgi:hypothetical protein
MTLNNMDDTLRGWAKLDTAAGESAIQIDVSLPAKPCSVVFALVVVSILAALSPFIVFLPSKLPGC